MAVKAGADIIAALNEVITAELTAINQYFVHAKMLQDWGYDRLYTQVRAESIDEMRHADQLIERVLYLDGIPNMQRMFRVHVGQNVQEMFEFDKAVEEEAIPRLNKAISLCVEQSDNGSRAMLEAILVSEEEHLDWLEAQLAQIEQMGLPNYLAQQIRPA